MRCPASGGRATIVTVASQSEEERHICPSFLSDGRHFLYLSVSRTKPETSGIYAGELGAASPRSANRLITTGFGAAFVAALDSGPGVIVFARDGALFAQRFNERRLELIGDPVRLAGRVGSYLDTAFFSVSPKTLVYRAELTSRTFWPFAREFSPFKTARGDHETARLIPDTVLPRYSWDRTRSGSPSARGRKGGRPEVMRPR
jgi:hypothetical protein